MKSLERFNHWRKGNDKIVHVAPHSLGAALGSEKSKAFASQDCNCDPCTCTGD